MTNLHNIDETHSREINRIIIHCSASDFGDTIYEFFNSSFNFLILNNL